MPSWLSSVTGWLTIFTPKPDAFRVAWASFCESVVTSGTVEVVGPLDTWSVIVAPGGWNVPTPGIVLTTVSFGASDLTASRLTAKPSPSKVEFADSNVEPITFGIATGFGPFETLSVTTVPCFTDAPAVGDWESAWSRGSPTTLGTSVLGGPSET